MKLDGGVLIDNDEVAGAGDAATNELQEDHDSDNATPPKLRRTNGKKSGKRKITDVEDDAAEVSCTVPGETLRSPQLDISTTRRLFLRRNLR